MSDEELKWEPIGDTICKTKLGTMHVSRDAGHPETWSWGAQLHKSNFSCFGRCGEDGQELAKTCAFKALEAMKVMRDIGSYSTSAPVPESATDVDMATPAGSCILCGNPATTCFHPVTEVRAFIAGVRRVTVGS